MLRVPTAIKQRIVAILLYITSTIILLWVFQNQMHNLSRFAQLDSSSLGTTESSESPNHEPVSNKLVPDFPTSIFKTAAADFGLTQEEVGGNPTEPVLVFHTYSSLCDTINSDSLAHDIPWRSKKKIAILAPRGGCTLEEKARNTVSRFQTVNEQVKYLLIYDYNETEEGPQIHISSNDGEEDLDAPPIPLMLLLVSFDSAQAIVDAMAESGTDGDERNSITISIDSATTKPTLESDSQSWSSLMSTILSGSVENKIKILALQVFASLVVTLLSFIFTASVLLYCWRDTIFIEISRNGIMFSQLDNEYDSEPKNLLEENEVLRLPQIEYCGAAGTTDEESPSSSVKVHCNSTSCSICLEDFDLKEKVRVLPCGHLFHTECILPWLTTRVANCPLCKESFKENDPHEESIFGRCLRVRNIRNDNNEDVGIGSTRDDMNLVDSSSTNGNTTSIGQIENGTPRRRLV